MDSETFRLILVNLPNYAGFFLLYRQQARIIDHLFKVLERRERSDHEPGDRL